MLLLSLARPLACHDEAMNHFLEWKLDCDAGPMLLDQRDANHDNENDTTVDKMLFQASEQCLTKLHVNLKLSGIIHC